MTDKKLVGVSLIKHYDDGSTEAWQKVSAPAIGAILAAGLAVAQSTQRSGSKHVYENSDVCTAHNAPWTVKEGGYNEERGTRWPAFWKCDGKDENDDWCNHRPSKAWVETHPPDRAGNDAESASDFDDLPF